MKKCDEVPDLVAGFMLFLENIDNAVVNIKEIVMATMDTPMVERRQLPDRRSGAMKQGLNAVDWVAMVLLIVGGLNWGLIGLMNLDVVAVLLGEATMAARAVYLLVGLSALYAIYMSFRMAEHR